jgi:hypothetical protein
LILCYSVATKRSTMLREDGFLSKACLVLPWILMAAVVSSMFAFSSLHPSSGVPQEVLIAVPSAYSGKHQPSSWMGDLEAIKYERKTLQDKVKSFKDAIFGDLRMIQKMATGKTSELTPEWKAIPPSSPISTSQASTPTALRSSPSEWTELEIEHKKLDRWTAALGDQMLSQCYAAARLLKGTAAIVAARRCFARVERRAQRYIHTTLLGDSDSQSGDDAMAVPNAATAGPVIPGRLPGGHAAMASGRRPAADFAGAASGEGGHGLWAAAGRRGGGGVGRGQRAGPRISLKQYAPTVIQQVPAYTVQT